MPVRCTAIIVFILLGFSSLAQGAIEIAHPKMRLQTDRYMVELMKIALNYYPDKYTFSEYESLATKTRLREMVQNGQLSVLWTGSSKALDEILLPVHIPAYKGLMGHRVFIIRQGDQSRFDNVRNLSDLRTITFGQGKSWSDTKILEKAGFKVVTSAKPAGLYYMLDGARFDAFPRGAHEPWAEIANRPNLSLTVEKNLVLKYTMPYYFYVSQSNRELAQDLTEGLKLAIEDGSFDEHFYNDSDVKLALERSNLKERTIYTIKNPNVSSAVPTDQPELWLDLSK